MGKTDDSRQYIIILVESHSMGLVEKIPLSVSIVTSISTKERPYFTEFVFEVNHHTDISKDILYFLT